MEKRNLIICAAQYIHVDGGYLSRIMSEIDKLNLEFNIYIYAPQGKADESIFSNKVTVIKYPYIYNGNDVYSYYLNVKSCRKHFRKLIKSVNNPIIYCEALVGSMWVLDIARKAHLQIVFDCHGTEADEYFMLSPTLKRTAYAYLLRYFEKKAIKISDLIVTVSNKQYQKWNIKTKYVKYPMIPAEQFFESHNYRKETRDELNIPDDAVVFVYSGGAAAWQMCNETIALYKRIEEKMPSAYLLVLTGKQDVFKTIINKLSIKKYRILTAQYQDVPKYLDAADYGFCIRANHIVNNVASPTKILEYLARNVKPVITDCIGDFSEELGSRNLACIMNSSLDNLQDIDISENFDGANYVAQVKNEYAEQYVCALKKL